MMLELFDPSSLDYEQWLHYFFDRPVIESPIGGEELAKQTSLVTVENKRNLLLHLKRFNDEISLVQKKFSMAQIDQGLWVLYGGGVHAGSLLVAPDIPIDERLSMIESFVPLYRQIVLQWEGDIKNSVFFMLWDLILRWMQLKAAGEESDPRDSRLVFDKCTEILSNILALGGRACELCALHGFGHLGTLSAQQAIQSYLNAHPELNAEDRGWVELCKRGSV
jgi:hypothetical protein